MEKSIITLFKTTLLQINNASDITINNKNLDDFSEISFGNIKLTKKSFSKILSYVIADVLVDEYLSNSEYLELKSLVEDRKNFLELEEKSKKHKTTNNMKKEYKEEKADNEIKILRNHGIKFDYTFDYNSRDKITIVLNREGCSLKDMASKLKKGERLIFMLNDGHDYNHTYDESCDGSIYWYNKIYGICARIGSDMGSILEWGRGIQDDDTSDETIKIENDDMKFRIVETQFDNHSKFEPEWFCANKTARNYGWNAVHDSELMTTPTNTYNESLERIKWFSKCFEKPKNVVIHENVVIHDVIETPISNNQTKSNQDFMDFMDYLHEKNYLNIDNIIKDNVSTSVEPYSATLYSTLRDVVKNFNNK